MKRDWDLVRLILIALDDAPDDQLQLEFGIAGYESLTVNYQLLRLFEAGLISGEAEKTKTRRLIRVFPNSLTWDGHEFLDVIRDPKRWEAVKEKAAGVGGAVGLDLLKKLAIGLITKKLKDHTGLDI